MASLKNILETLPQTERLLESFGRSGRGVCCHSGADFVRSVQACREALNRAHVRGSDLAGRRVVGLLFKPEETVEFLVASFAAMAEGLAIVPFFPNWPPETQVRYLRAYDIRSMIVGPGFRQRAAGWKGELLDEVFPLSVEGLLETAGSSDQREFPELPPEHPCAYIFTSGTSSDVAKLTEISRQNLDAAIENIQALDFLEPGMTLHSPLSTSHIFAFVVVLGFLATRPKRLIFSDIQYLSRLPQSATGKVDGLILVPIVLNRVRAGFYEKLVTEWKGNAIPPEFRKLARIPLTVRRGLKRLLVRAEEAVIELESVGHMRPRGWAAVQTIRRTLGKRIRERLGSPDFVVVGGAKPNMHSMAFLEVMGIRCLQGWGMTETTGPLAVCRPGDRYRGAFGTCGLLFPRTTASVDEGELIVGGPQIARGYLEPGGRFVPFNGTKRTGDFADFDGLGRLKILGKASDRITTENGLNYNPIPFEERIVAMDLESAQRLDEVVVIGEGRPRLGVVFFLREAVKDDEATRDYLSTLLAEFNNSRAIDERLDVWSVAPEPFKESGLLGPSGKLVRHRAETRFAKLFPAVVGA